MLEAATGRSAGRTHLLRPGRTGGRHAAAGLIQADRRRDLCPENGGGFQRGLRANVARQTVEMGDDWTVNALMNGFYERLNKKHCFGYVGTSKL